MHVVACLSSDKKIELKPLSLSSKIQIKWKCVYLKRIKHKRYE